MTTTRFGLRTALAIVIALGISACSGERPIPTAPTALPSPPATRVPVPPEPNSPHIYTLAGVISGSTPEGPLPLSDAVVVVGVCPRVNYSPESYMTTVTDADGSYRVQGMCAGVTYVWVSKAGYKTSPPKQCDGDCLYATINGDTQFDIELVRQ